LLSYQYNIAKYELYSIFNSISMCKNTKKTSFLLGLSKFLYNFVRK